MSTARRKEFVLSALAALLLGVGAMAAEPVSPNAEILAGGSLAGAPDPTIRMFNSMTGEMYADVMGASVTAQRLFKSALPSIADYSQSAHKVSAADCTTSYCAPDSNWVMWDTPFLSWDRRKRDDGYLGYEQNVSGFATGISRMFGETTALGLALGYDGRKLTGRDDYAWRNKADVFHGALYGGTALGCFFVDGYAGYSRAWHRSERYVEGPGSGYVNHGNYNDTVLSAGLKASYVWILPNEMRITPAIGFDYSHIRMGSFNEHGYEFATGNESNLTALRLNKSTYDSYQMPITVSVNKTFTSDFLTFLGKCSLWTPEVRAGYIPQFGSKRADVTYSFVNAQNGPFYEANSAKLGGSYGTVGAGLKIKLADKYIFAIDYDFLFASKYNNHTVTGTYGVSF